jgi:hypothetical protein
MKKACTTFFSFLKTMPLLRGLFVFLQDCSAINTIILSRNTADTNYHPEFQSIKSNIAIQNENQLRLINTQIFNNFYNSFRL